MTNKNKKIIIGTSMVVLTTIIVYLIYKRNLNKKNSELMSNYIDELPKINTQSAINETLNKDTDAAQNQTTGAYQDIAKKYNPPVVILDGRRLNLANPTESKIARDLMANILSNLGASMSGLKTNTKEFDRNFKRIGSYSAFTYLNSIYKIIYKEDLWSAIKGESKLYFGNSIISSIQDFFSKSADFRAVIGEQAKVWADVEPTLKRR
jgi:hypothetical protein